ncbi:hypothetical protein G3I67_03650 [Orrella sp. NBD-18]|uniref:Uncharacterized protein n=1 Tax=Sheuella amnicola TaxID=2707330 RepID=A0A6B2QVZ5_9BURK|nr:hypothetical protein [Sheuella amnicola]NDY82321.1 hypothetical protein [Sheuella amnicola]
MNNLKKIKRIKTLIDRLEKNQSVTRGSLTRVLGEVGIRSLDKQWGLELKSRTYKPKEIVEYSERVRRGLIYYALGDKQSLKGDGYKARNSFHKAESILENAVEYLREVVTTDSSLRLWIDRDVGFGVEVELCPVGIPRPVWSTSNYKSQCSLPKVTKRDLAREMLQTELEKLVGREPLELENLEFGTKRSFDISSFSGFKF